MSYKAEGKCVDCGKVFLKRAENQVRCPECQRVHRREIDRARKSHYKPKVKKDITEAVYRNGHPQVCEYTKSCFYGGRETQGCNYLLETGRLRVKDGLFIENGKCPAYMPKGTKKMKRIRPVQFAKVRKEE